MVGDLQRPDLNALEEQVSISNQNVLAAEANFRAARYAIGDRTGSLVPDCLDRAIDHHLAIFGGLREWVYSLGGSWYRYDL